MQNPLTGNAGTNARAETRIRCTPGSVAATGGVPWPLANMAGTLALAVEQALPVLRLFRSSCASQNKSGMTNLIAAVAGHQANLCVLDLPARRIGVTHLAHAFDNLQHAFGMRL